MWIKIQTWFAAEKDRLQDLRSKGTGDPDDLAKMPKFLDISPDEVLEQ